LAQKKFAGKLISFSVSLDRLDRNLKHPTKLSSKFENMGAELISLKENIDISTAMGRFFFQMTGVFL